MAELPKKICVAVDLAGCPNRCRHCYLGCGPNGRLPDEFLRTASEAFCSWKQPGQSQAYFEQVDMYSWYREPDFSYNYRQLYQLEADLSGHKPQRFELMSIWRLARDDSYVKWAREIGPDTCQITFFGMKDTSDNFYGRTGAFDDAIKATQVLLENKMVPRWQIILTQAALGELQELCELASKLGIAEKLAESGRKFDIFCNLPGPAGQAWQLENMRLRLEDIDKIPQKLLQATTDYSGGKLNWQSEAEIISQIIQGHSLPKYIPPTTCFFINAELEVFSNYGELTPQWSLGNFDRDGLDVILDNFRQDSPAGFQMAYHSDDLWLAENFGRKNSDRLYTTGDLKERWVKMAAQNLA